MKKKLIIALTVATLCFSSVSCSKTTTDTTSNTNDTVIESTTNDDTSASSTIENIDEEIGDITCSISLGDTITTSGNGATVTNNTITISSGGTYEITGTSSDAQIIVDSSSEENVYLVLNNVNLTCSDSAPLYVKAAKNTIIFLPDGTENTITDSESYTFEDTSTDEPNAAIFSKDDLTIKGSGSLTVNANYNNGITSKDDLKITGGNISITSADDGLMGKDSITIKNGNIDINSSGDGLKSTNAEDTSKGYILIEGGTLNIDATNDGIQAESNVTISDGNINITTGGGSVNSSSSSDTSSNWGQWGGGAPGGTTSSTSTDTTSAKAIKAVSSITIDGGTFNIDSSDDSIHSNDAVIINGGTFEIASGDDGIHSDTTLEINGGDINISKSYEGIESTAITINDGTIHLVASDDGLNAAGGNDSSATSGRPGQNSFSSSSNGSITFNGGYIYVDASGDGVDANGSIVMNDGTVIVNGPENSGNGALDYDSSCEINGGLFIAAGASGMAQSPSNTSTQNSINVFVNGTANNLITIKSESGEDIISFAPSKTYQSVIISSPNLETGESYTVYSGATSNGISSDGLYSDGTTTGGTEITSFTISNTVSNISQNGTTTGGNSTAPGGNMTKPSGGTGGRR